MNTTFYLGLTLARIGMLNSDDVAVGVNVIQEAICGTQSDPTINIPRTVTVESYRYVDDYDDFTNFKNFTYFFFRPNASLYCTFIDDGLFLIQLLSTA